MKLTMGQVRRAYIAVMEIAKNDRAMPDKGKYRVARLAALLKGEFEASEKARHDLIKSYGKATEDGGAMVPPEKIGDYGERWLALEAVEVDVAVRAIPLSQIFMPAGEKDAPAVNPVSVGELIGLGPLVEDDLGIEAA